MEFILSYPVANMLRNIESLGSLRVRKPKTIPERYSKAAKPEVLQGCLAFDNFLPLLLNHLAHVPHTVRLLELTHPSFRKPVMKHLPWDIRPVFFPFL